MGLFDAFKKKETLAPIEVSDDAVIAPADGELIDITTVPDEVFTQKMMGDGVAFRYSGDKVTLCAPANGVLSVLFPTGHAFGVTMANGTELLVHCGINTVEANGDGFKLCAKKQGDTVKAGEPIVEVNLKKLGAKYDMSTMLICTNGADHPMTFSKPKTVKRGDSVLG